MSRVSPIAGPALVLHADDFGMNEAVNEGVLRCFSHGALTSASILANAPACLAAIAGWKELLLRQRHGALFSTSLRQRLGDAPRPFDLGVHLNLTQGRPLTGPHYPAELLDAEGRFPGIGALFRRLMFSHRRYVDRISAELAAQIEALFDQGIIPTHLNGHQYVELLPPVGELVLRLAARYSIPVVRVAWELGLTRSTLGANFELGNWCLAQIKRGFACRFLLQARRARVSFPGAYFGTAHAGRVDLRIANCFLGQARRFGIAEIGLHPAAESTSPSEESSDGWFDPLAMQRAAECRLLTSPEFYALLENGGFRLGRLSELWRPQQTSAAA